MSYFEDKVVCLTGKFSGYTRKELQKKLEAAGATVKSSVTNHVQVLVAGENAGSKLAKANKKGIPVLDESKTRKKLGWRLYASDSESDSVSEESSLPPPKSKAKKKAKKKTASKKAVPKKKASKRKRSDMEDSDELDVDSMTVKDLKRELKSRGLSCVGKKAKLTQRLCDALADGSSDDQSEEDSEPASDGKHSSDEKSEPESDELSVERIDKMLVSELRVELRERELSIKGKKAVLVARLKKALSGGESDDSEEESQSPEPPKKKKKTNSGKASPTKALAAMESRGGRERSGRSAVDLATSDLPAVAKGVKAPNVRAEAWRHFGKWPNDTSYELKRVIVLMCSKISGGKNNNKYYALEQHVSECGTGFRLFTHYGRLDDLSGNPEAGKKECRYYTTQVHCDAAFVKIYKSKTAASKGYKPVNVASSSVGSPKARGRHVGAIGDATKSKMQEECESEGDDELESGSGSRDRRPALDSRMGELMDYLFKEAKQRIAATMDVQMTADGFKTPLGTLTLEQIEEGEDILLEMYTLFKKGKAKNKSQIEELTNDFYSTIPWKLGRSRHGLAANKFTAHIDFEQKAETLQIMKDMLKVNANAESGGKRRSVLGDSAEVYDLYQSLGVEMRALDKGSGEWKRLVKDMDESVSRSHRCMKIKVKNIYKVKRTLECEGFDSEVGNERRLFHGSRCCNWVGILSRGLLMPKVVVSMGGSRTDGGWLGDGIYFGEADTGCGYAQAGNKGTAFVLVSTVALGKAKRYNKITYGLTIPKGYDSAHGDPKLKPSQFHDNEYVIYDESQRKMEYLVEIGKH